MNALEMFVVEKVAFRLSDINLKSVGDVEALEGTKRYTVEESFERRPAAGCGGSEEAVLAIVRVAKRTVRSMFFIVRFYPRTLENRESEKLIQFPMLLCGCR